MLFLELLRQSVHHLLQYKFRNALVIVGVAWGTLSIVLLMALSTSFHNNALRRIHSVLGKNTLFFSLTQTTLPYHGYPAHRPLHLKANTIMNLKKNIPEINFISPGLISPAPITANHAAPLQALIFGVSADYGTLFNITFGKNKGHFLGTLDVSRAQYTAVIDEKTASTFFEKQNPIGKTLSIQGLPFRIVGIQLPKEGVSLNSGNGGKSRPAVFIPYTTFQRLWGNPDSWLNLIAPKDQRQIDHIKKIIRSTLSIQFDIAPQDEQAFQFGDFDSFRQSTNALFSKLKTFFLLSGALALMIGGIGVANIMFLTVNQRAREIGLAMALGAQDKHILSQVLLESSLLVLLGGVLGFILSGLAIIELQTFPLSTVGRPTLPLSVIATSLGCLSLLGLLAGYFPARKAMRLNPVEAFNKVG